MRCVQFNGPRIRRTGSGLLSRRPCSSGFWHLLAGDQDRWQTEPRMLLNGGGQDLKSKVWNIEFRPLRPFRRPSSASNQSRDYLFRRGHFVSARLLRKPAPNLLPRWPDVAEGKNASLQRLHSCTGRPRTPASALQRLPAPGCATPTVYIRRKCTMLTVSPAKH